MIREILRISRAFSVSFLCAASFSSSFLRLFSLLYKGKHTQRLPFSTCLSKQTHTYWPLWCVRSMAPLHHHIHTCKVVSWRTCLLLLLITFLFSSRIAQEEDVSSQKSTSVLSLSLDYTSSRAASDFLWTAIPYTWAFRAHICRSVDLHYSLDALRLQTQSATSLVGGTCVQVSPHWWQLWFMGN